MQRSKSLYTLTLAVLLALLAIPIPAAAAPTPPDLTVAGCDGQAVTDPQATCPPSTRTAGHSSAPTKSTGVPPIVLWDQPLSTVNQNAFVDQEFPDLPGNSTFIADDFVNTTTWTIGTIYIPGNGWSGFTSLSNATALHWMIYADNGGVPAGDPSGGGAAPVWSLTLPPSDTQVVITNGTPFVAPSDTQLNLTTPINLPPGHYWLVFYPTLPFSTDGQYGRQVADTANGYVARIINPGGAFGFSIGTVWGSLNQALSMTQADIAFRLEEPAPATVKTSAATLVTTSGATLNGTVNANSSSATVAFDYGLTTAYGHTIAATPGFVTGSTSTAVSAALTDLQPNTTYHFRAMASNAIGTAGGLDQTFTTGIMTERANNGGFETYVGASKIPKGWTAVKFGALDGKDKQNKKIGKASIKFVGAGSATKTLTETLTLTGTAGDAFALSYWVKGSALPKAGTCQVQVSLYNGPVLAGTRIVKCPSGASFNWQKITGPIFTAPSVYTKVVIKITVKKTSGTVWFDGVSLMK